MKALLDVLALVGPLVRPDCDQAGVQYRQHAIEGGEHRVARSAAGDSRSGRGDHSDRVDQGGEG